MMLRKRFIITSLGLVSLIVPTTLAKRQTRNYAPTEFKNCSDTGKKCIVDNLFASDPFGASEVRVQLEENGPFAQFSSKTIAMDTYKGTAAGKRQWYGVDEAGIFTMNLLEDENFIFGSVTVGDKVYSIGPNADGETEVNIRDTSDYPPEGHSPDEDDALDAFDLTRSLISSYEVSALQGQITESSDAEQPALSFNTTARGEQNPMTPSDIKATSLQSENDPRVLNAPTSIIDVMVVWTKNAECKLATGKRDCTLNAATRITIRGKIDLAVQETNVAFANSGIDAQVNLIHAYRDESYEEPSDDAFLNALYAITRTTDNIMDDVHEKRQRYGADMVHFMIDDDQLCGIAWMGPAINLMFSVSSWQCATGYFSFGHELAHNMGCSHDRGTSNTCDDNGKYSYGYRDPAGGFRSIMGYNCKTGGCDNIQKNGCGRVQRFSNTVIDYNGMAIGTAKENNARQFNDVRETVANYYQTCEERCDDNDASTLDTCTDGYCTHSTLTVPGAVPLPTVPPTHGPTTEPSPPLPAASGILETTMQGGTGQVGNMFEIQAKKNIDITRFYIHTTSTDFITCNVRTQKGSYLPVSGDGWTLLNTFNIQGQGQGQYTELPLLDPPVGILAGERQAFYITLDGADKLVYTRGTVVDQVFSENGDLQFFEGHGMAADASSWNWSPRIWNGKIAYDHATPILSSSPPTVQPTTKEPTPVPTLSPTHLPTSEPTTIPTPQPTPVPTASPTHRPTSEPTMLPTPQPTPVPTVLPTHPPTSEPTRIPTLQPTTKEPTPVPTVSPTSRPTSEPTMTPTPQPPPPPLTAPSGPTLSVPSPPLPAASGPTLSVLETTMQGGTGQAGNMFEIQAKKNIDITRFYIHTASTGFVNCNVRTQEGGYRPVSGDGWTLLNTFNIQGQGQGQYTELPLLDPPVRLLAGERQAFYITLDSPDKLVYTRGTVVDQVFSENDDLQFFEGHGTAADASSWNWSPRIWNGKIAYNAATPLQSSSLSTGEPAPPKESTHVPTASPTHLPTSEPTTIPTPQPTPVPTASPTHRPTSEPTMLPTPQPTPVPTASPTPGPTSKPNTWSLPWTSEPTMIPTPQPTTKEPTPAPTVSPTHRPTSEPTMVPTPHPTPVPTVSPTHLPTFEPTAFPLATVSCEEGGSRCRSNDECCSSDCVPSVRRWRADRCA